MSVEASSWAWKQQIKSGTKLVLLCLADHADKDGMCWPGQDGVSEKCGMDRATVNQHIRKLVNFGLVQLKHRSDDHGYRKSNLYVLNLSNVVNPKVGKTKVGISRSKVVFSDSNVVNHNSMESSDKQPSKEPSKEPPKPPASGRRRSHSNQPHPGFDEFWKLYPRRTNKQQALKAWNKLKPDSDLQAKIHAAIKRQSRTEQWLKDDGKFIPHPSTWLNGCRWEDEIPKEAKPRFYGIPGLGAGI